MSESAEHYTRPRGEINESVLKELGFEQYRLRSPEWFYQGQMAFYSPDFGSVKLRGLSCYIRKKEDLKTVRDWIDQPSDKKRYSERQQRYI